MWAFDLYVVLVSDIVMILNDIFAYIFPETGWIWTNLAEGWGEGKG